MLIIEVPTLHTAGFLNPHSVRLSLCVAIGNGRPIVPGLVMLVLRPESDAKKRKEANSAS
jgi:hypothetical protein